MKEFAQGDGGISVKLRPVLISFAWGVRLQRRHRHSVTSPGPRAVVCLPASFWLLPCPASSPRGPSSRRLAALLSAGEGHRPLLALPEALDFGRRGDRGARRGQGGRVGDGERAFEVPRLTALYYQAGWDPDSPLSRLSPGVVLMGQSIEDDFERPALL